MQIPFGLRMVAPVLMAFGSAEQQQRFLPRIVSGADAVTRQQLVEQVGPKLKATRDRVVAAVGGAI